MEQEDPLDEALTIVIILYGCGPAFGLFLLWLSVYFK